MPSIEGGERTTLPLTGLFVRPSAPLHCRAHSLLLRSPCLEEPLPRVLERGRLAWPACVHGPDLIVEWNSSVFLFLDASFDMFSESLA